MVRDWGCLPGIVHSRCFDRVEEGGVAQDVVNAACTCGAPSREVEVGGVVHGCG